MQLDTFTSPVHLLYTLQEQPTEEHADQDDVITPDAAELDEENARRLQEKGTHLVSVLVCNKRYFHFLAEKQDFLLRSQAVQRSLPRPNDVNTTILRGAVHPDQKMKSLYEVCELSELAKGMASL